MHGDETVGRQLIIYFAEYLLQNYNIEDRVTNLVDTIEIYLMPSLNPDGFAKSQEGSCYSDPGRYNGNGKDLNRDFPKRFDFPFGSDWGEMEQGRQPETIAMMKWIQKEPFVLVCSDISCIFNIFSEWMCIHIRHLFGLMSKNS